MKITLSKFALLLLGIFALVACDNTEGPVVNPDDDPSNNTQLPSDAFAIEVEEVHATSAITEVTPVDKQMYYVMYLDVVSYFQDGGIETAEQL